MNAASQRAREGLRGVLAGLLTPFDEAGEIRHAAIERNATALADRGIGSFLAAANISEFHALSQAERVAVTETSVASVPDDACVLAGVGGSIPAALDLIAAYDRVGVDVMMIMPPDHTFQHEQGLLRYHRELAEATDTPLVPYVRGLEPSASYLADLTHIDGVVGMKYAVPDPVLLGEAVDDGASDVVWVCGLAEPYAVSFWPEGIEGFTAGVSNFRPAVGLALFEALTNGEWDRARALRNACLPFQRLRDEPGSENSLPGGLSVPAVKRGLDRAGLEGGTVRPPIEELSSTDVTRVDECYDRLEEALDRLLDDK